MNEGKKDRRDPIRTVKPRNFVAKNAGATTSGAGVHKDKKKADKQGYEKHKGKEYAESLEYKLKEAFEKDFCPVCGCTPCNCTHIVSESKTAINFDVEDLKRLEKIKDLPTLKAQAFSLISKPSQRPMKPEKVEWFKRALENMNSPMKVIKLMYDLLLSGEGHSVLGSKSSMNPNSYRQRFGEEAGEGNFDAEYDDEAGMADNNLETLERAVQGIDDLIDEGDNLPEWCQEKIAVAKSMLVAVWDYMRSEEDSVGEQGVAEGSKWRNNPNAHDINDDGDIYPKTRDMFAYDPLTRRQSTAGDARTARGKKSALKTSLKMAQGRHGPKSQLPEEQGVAEGKGPTDMTGKTCEKCKKDKYYEREFHDDMDGVVRCSCGHKVDRWRKNKDQGVAEGSKKPHPDDHPEYYRYYQELEPKKQKKQKPNKSQDPDPFENPEYYRKEQGVAEETTDVYRKVFKKNGKPVGEVGIDLEASPGNGDWYVKHYASNTNYSGYDTRQDAIDELKYMVSQGLDEQGVAEGWGAERQARELEASNAAWRDMLARYANDPEMTEYLTMFRISNWGPKKAEAESKRWIENDKPLPSWYVDLKSGKKKELGYKIGEDQGIDDIVAWKQAVIKAYPRYAGQMKFKGRGTQISAEIPGLDRSFGVFDLETGTGQVLDEGKIYLDKLTNALAEAVRKL